MFTPSNLLPSCATHDSVPIPCSARKPAHAGAWVIARTGRRAIAPIADQSWLRSCPKRTLESCELQRLQMNPHRHPPKRKSGPSRNNAICILATFSRQEAPITMKEGIRHRSQRPAARLPRVHISEEYESTAWSRPGRSSIRMSRSLRKNPQKAPKPNRATQGRSRTRAVRRAAEKARSSVRPTRRKHGQRIQKR